MLQYRNKVLLEFVLFDNDDKSRKDHVVRLGEMWEGFGVYKMNIICNLSGLYFALFLIFNSRSYLLLIRLKVKVRVWTQIEF